jgi:FixJ family two-component response regulator
MATCAPTVVVVEDDATVRSALARLLEIAGFEVEAFGSAEDCLASGVVASAHCLVCDVHLPGDSGLELCRRLMQAGSKAPVIFITGHDSPTARAEAEHLGAAAYLPKPFEGRALLDAIRSAIGSP